MRWWRRPISLTWVSLSWMMHTVCGQSHGVNTLRPLAAALWWDVRDKTASLGRRSAWDAARVDRLGTQTGR